VTASLAGDTLCVAGQEGRDESNKLAAGGIGPETTPALAADVVNNARVEISAIAVKQT